MPTFMQKTGFCQKGQNGFSYNLNYSLTLTIRGPYADIVESEMLKNIH